MNAPALIKIWAQTVGAVLWDADRGLAVFEYDGDFLQNGYDLAPLKMPLQSEKRIYEFPELRKDRYSEYDTFKGLPGLLADVLPDRYGNQLINVWLARNGRAENSMDPVEMLCFIGKRGMGALEFEPATKLKGEKGFSVEIDTLVEVAAKALHKKEELKASFGNDDEEAAIRQILKVGTSAGGARPKAVIAYNEKTNEVRSGQTSVPEGFEHWLLKLDGVSDVQLGSTHGYGRVEMAYYEMAKACGIEMMPCKLLEENGRAHFMTKRYDRDGANVKHHVQTFCALKHYDYNEVTSYSYEQLFQAMREIKLTYPEAEQMYRRMVFNVLARNCDDHTKNFSFILKKGQKWALAPAYDLCYAYRPDSQWVSQHALSINGKRKEITRKDLLSITGAVKIKGADQIIDEVKEAVLNWESFAGKVGVAKSLTEEIQRNLIAHKDY